MAISTLGKVIKRGWDWLGVTSLQAERINGLIEVPDLAASLTLNKGDFIRTGSRGAVYLAYRKAIQEAVSRQLEKLGAMGALELREASSRMMRPLERDLDPALEELSDYFPLLGSLVERRAGGQKRLPIDGTTPDSAAGHDNTRTCDSDNPYSTSTMLPGHGRSRAPMRYGLGIQFEDRPDDLVLGRLVEIHRLDQPSPFRLPARAGIPLRGLSHFARRRARIGPVSRRAESGTHLHHQISVLLGQALEQTPNRRRRPRR